MSRKIVAYGSVAGKTLTELNDLVRDAINHGAEPLGGIVFLGYTREYPNKRAGFGVNALARDVEEIERPFVQTLIQYEEEESTIEADHRKQRGRSDKR